MNQLLETLDDIVWSIEYPGFKRRFINSAAQKILNIELKELYKDDYLWENLIHKHDLPKFKKEFDYLINKGEHEFEYRIKTPDGQVINIFEKAWVVYDDEGKPIRIEGVAKDITSQKNVENEYFKGKELYFTVLNNLHGFAVFVFSPFLKIVYADGKLLTEKEIEKEKLIGASLRKVLKHFTAEPLNIVRDVFKGSSFKFETYNQSNFYEFSLSPLRDNMGRIDSGILLVHDLTESKIYSNNVVRSVLQTQDLLNNKLALNIHEDLGQMIFSIKLQVDKMEKHIHDQKGADAEELKNIKNNICGAITQIKNISQDLSPSQLDDFGVQTALPNLCLELESKKDVNINLRQRFRTERFNKEFELSIYKFFQETLELLIDKQNSTNISIFISEREGYFNLKIINDGISFDNESLNQTFKLEARINAFNGSLRIFPGESMNKMLIQIPVKEASAV